MPPYVVEKVDRQDHLDSIVDIIWTAMDGVDPSHRIFFPVFGDTVTDRAKAIQLSKVRIWNDHQSDPASHWIFVRDSASHEIIGGCQWRIYSKNPFPDGTPHIEALWWPDGDGRHFASEVVRQCYTPRTKWMARPHVGMSLMCVLPQVQRRGIGGVLMQWGMAEADKLGLESFIEATHGGQGLYAGCGYRNVASVGVEVSLADASQEWRDLTARLLPVGYTAMWRPVLGIWEPEEPGKTWQQRLEAAGDVGISVLESCT